MTILKCIIWVKVWNSKCIYCSEILGNESLEKAQAELESEKRAFKEEAKIGTIKLQNMKLMCTNCGGVNHERELYKASKEH